MGTMAFAVHGGASSPALSPSKFAMRCRRACFNGHVKLEKGSCKRSAVAMGIHGGVQPRAATAPSPSTTSVSIMQALSSVIGWSVLAGSLLYKLPQVIRVARKKRGEGISLSGLALETIGVGLSGVYALRNGFPISTFGETLFIPIQNVVIMSLVIKFERVSKWPWIIFFALYAVCSLVMLNPSFPVKVLAILNLCATPISCASRIPQLLLNWRSKGTGELAPITLGLQLLGNLARIFTTLVSTKDLVLLLGFSSAAVLNGSLFLQWWYYNKRPTYAA